MSTPLRGTFRLPAMHAWTTQTASGSHLSTMMRLPLKTGFAYITRTPCEVILTFILVLLSRFIPTMLQAGSAMLICIPSASTTAAPLLRDTRVTSSLSANIRPLKQCGLANFEDGLEARIQNSSTSVFAEVRESKKLKVQLCLNRWHQIAWS